MRKAQQIMKVILFTSLLFLLTACDLDELGKDSETLENGGAYKEEVTIDLNKEIEDRKEERNKEKTETLKLLSLLQIKAESMDIEEDLEKVDTKVHDLNGYISSHKVEANNERSNVKEADISIRVPKDKIDELKDFLKDIINIKSDSSNSIDITEDYHNYELELKNLELQEKRLMEMYEQAEDVKELVEIDEKLLDVIEKKEKTSREYKKMNEQAEYAKVNLELIEVEEFTSDGKTQENSRTRLLKAVDKSYSKIRSGIVSLLIVLIYLFPLVSGAIIILYIYVNIKKKID